MNLIFLIKFLLNLFDILNIIILKLFILASA